MSRLNGILEELADRSLQTVWYGTCSTASSGTTDKIVTVDDGFTLQTGVTIAITFDNDCIATMGYERKLNVNDTGAIPISVKGMTTMTYNPWSAGDVVLFVYDGTYWQMVSPTTGKRSDIASQVTLTKTGGVSASTCTLQSAIRIGDTVVCNIRVDAGAAVAAGSNVIQFTLNIGGKWTSGVSTLSYNGAVSVAFLKPNGAAPSCTVRALGAVTAAMYFTCYATFVIEG